jgi:hypothetical protein
MSNKILKENDIFQNLKVTKTTDSFCFFDKKRMSWSTIEKLINSGEKIIHRVSPNSIVDWKSKENVVKYHNSFSYWNTYLSGYSNKFETFKGILEVKDGLVLYNDEYFLPCPISKWDGGQSWWNAKQEDVKDGKYFVTLLKQENDWYPKEDINLRKNITLNLFMMNNKVVDSVKELKRNSNELWASKYGDGINFNYDRSVWDGLSFHLDTLDMEKLFTKYFIKQRWRDVLNIEMTRSEIYKIMFPIEGELRTILSDALYGRKFTISIDESYGEVSVSNMLQFDDKVAQKVFDLIENQIKITDDKITNE